MTLKSIQKEQAIFMFSRDLTMTFSEPSETPSVEDLHDADCSYMERDLNLSFP